MVDFKEIEKKWQKRWEDSGIFKAEIDKRKKYFITTPYPYMNGLLHLGHLFTYIPPEVMARFKRMQGYNVLFKFAFHCTGTPIMAAAKRIEEKEQKQISILKQMGIPEKEIPKFADPLYWINYFPKEALRDLKTTGFTIDERHTFRTTSINPPYDAMVRWQLNKLKEKGLAKQGEHPVVWCPKDNLPVGDHDRLEGEGETPKDFIWTKFRLKGSDLILMAGTTRPDALLGQTNLWLDPTAEYKIIKVANEKWVIGERAVDKINNQFRKAEVIGSVKATELIGKWSKGPLVDYELYILPANFIDASLGSGIVYSALEDPVDLFELKKLQTDPSILKKYNLNKEVVSKLKPISIIQIDGMSDNLGEDIGREFAVKSAEDEENLEKAKNELNKRVFRKGVMKKNCGKYSGLPVPETQETLKKELIASKDAVMFYELTGKVVCRCLTDCIVKIVSDQWFIQYDDVEWKKLAHKCLDKMEITPEIVRKQFEYVLDWLRGWACTREYGLGTKLPWDQKWVIESLSDSTIQMAYNTISKYLEHPQDYGFKADKLNDQFFDYVFLGKGNAETIEKSTSVPKKMVETMRTDFEYWYPFDFRNSGKDLVQNHLSFCIFNHTAIFPEKHWPKRFLVNGRILVNNEKMSKSKGNFFTVRDLYEKHGADVIRLTSANSGEGVDDANFDMSFLESGRKKLDEWLEFVKEHYVNGRENTLSIDKWFESMMHKSIKETTEHLDGARYKSALKAGFFDLHRYLKWYLRKTGNNPNKKLITEFIEVQTKLLAPITPHLCEEIWESIGKKGFISNEEWPKYNPKKIDPKAEYSEDLVESTVTDIREVLGLVKLKPNQINLFVSEEWKYKFFEIAKKEIEETRDVKTVLKSVMSTDLKKYGKDIAFLAPQLVKDPSKIPQTILDQKQEIKILQDSKEFLEKEFICKIEIVPADKSTSARARKAEPGKPGIEVI